jgi:phosphatidylinositol phospholipase C, delta
MTTISETPSPSRKPSPSRPVVIQGLRRAGNILTPKGKLVPAIQQSILNISGGGSGGESSSNTSFEIDGIEKERRFSDGSNNNTLAFSFRKKFQEVKDASISIARRRSLNFKSAPPGLRGRNNVELPLSRSSSDLLRPTIVHANSAPETSLSIGLMATSVPSPHTHASLLSNLHLHHNHNPTAEEDPSSSNKSKMDIVVPLLLQQGTPMTKVSAKKQSRSVFRLDPDQGQIRWESKRRGIGKVFSLIPFISI